MSTRHAIALLALLIATACGREQVSHNVIVRCDSYTITCDSVVWGDIVAFSPDGSSIESNLKTAIDLPHTFRDSIRDHWMTDRKDLPSSHPYPLLSTGSRLVDAIYTMSCREVAYTSHDDTSPLTVALAGAMIEPDAARRQLTDFVRKHQETPLPTGCDHLDWSNAAWDLYCATGDKQWLEWAYNTLHATLINDSINLVDGYTPLCSGAVTGNDSYWLYPPEASEVNRYEWRTMRGSVMMMGAMAVHDEMAIELGLEPKYTDAMMRLKEAINQQFWNEHAGRYNAYSTDALDPGGVTDNLAQALWVIGRVADDDRAGQVLADTPMLPEGIPTTIPQNIYLEPLFTSTDWPVVQALWCMAAAAAGNEHALRMGWAALLRAQALFQPINLHMFDAGPDYSRLSYASIAVALRVIMGINFTPDGIAITPHVPVQLQGVKTVRGLRYRDATFDIAINGIGSNVVSMTIDGNEVNGGFIASPAAGHHRVVVHVSPSQAATGHVTHTTAAALQPAWQPLTQPAQVTQVALSDTIAHINVARGGRYRMAVGYADGNRGSLTRPTVNGHHAAIMYMPEYSSETRLSNMVTVELLPGRNTITLSPSTAAMQSLHIFKP